jgi:hypothetical protein
MNYSPSPSVTDEPIPLPMKLPAGPLGKLFPFLLWWHLVTRRSLRADACWPA